MAIMPTLDELYADVKKRRSRRHKTDRYDVALVAIFAIAIFGGIYIAGGAIFAELTLSQSVRAFGISAATLTLVGAICRWVAPALEKPRLDGFGKALAVIAGFLALLLAISLR